MVSEEIGDNRVAKFECQLAVEKEIWGGIHDKRLYLAEKASICKGSICDVFGYLATMIVTQQVLPGTYSYPEDFNQATQ